MDVNYLFHREGVERLRAERARSDQSREAHREMADNYRAMIDDFRRGRTDPSRED